MGNPKIEASPTEPPTCGGAFVVIKWIIITLIMPSLKDILNTFLPPNKHETPAECKKYSSLSFPKCAIFQFLQNLQLLKTHLQQHFGHFLRQIHVQLNCREQSQLCPMQNLSSNNGLKKKCAVYQVKIKVNCEWGFMSHIYLLSDFLLCSACLLVFLSKLQTSIYLFALMDRKLWQNVPKSLQRKVSKQDQ